MNSTFDQYPKYSTATEEEQSSPAMSPTLLEATQAPRLDDLDLEETQAGGSLHGKLDKDIDAYCRMDLANELNELPPVMRSRLVENIATEGQRLVAQITNPNTRQQLEAHADNSDEVDAATTEIILSSGAAWDISKDPSLYDGIMEAISTISNPSQKSYLYEALGQAMMNESSFVSNYAHAASERFQLRVMSEEDTQKEILDHEVLSKLDTELDNAVAHTAHTAISWQDRPELHAASDSPAPHDLDESLELYVGKAVRTSLVGQDEAHISPIKAAAIENDDTTHYPMLHLIDNVHPQKTESKTSAPETNKANHDVTMTKSGPTAKFGKFVVSSLASRLSRSRN